MRMFINLKNNFNALHTEIKACFSFTIQKNKCFFAKTVKNKRYMMTSFRGETTIVPKFSFVAHSSNGCQNTPPKMRLIFGDVYRFLL